MTALEPVGPPTAHARLVEFRLHGIGKHTEWSALGGPRLLENPSYPGTTSGHPPEESVRAAEPPGPFSRTVYLMNWSRTSSHWGRAVGKLWYIATPYTLVNVARHMRSDPQGSRSSRSLRALEAVGTHVTGLLLTALTLLWAVALVETLGRFRPLEPFSGAPEWGPVIVLVILAVLLGTILWRTQQARITVGGPTLLAHALVLVATAGVLFAQPFQGLTRTEPPSRLLLPLFSPAPMADFQRWCQGDDIESVACATAAGSGATHVFFFDPLTTFSLGALLVVSVVAIAHYAAGMRYAQPNVTGAGLALAAAVVTFLGFTSALRVALDFIVDYFNALAEDRPAVPMRTAVMPPYWESVTQGNGTQFTSNTLPLYGIAGLVVLVLTYLVLARLERGRLPQDKLHPNRKVVRARVRHQLVRRLPQTLAPTLIVSALICFTVWCVLYVAVTTQSQGRVATAMVVLLHLSYLLAFLVFALHRQIGFLDEILGKLADVVGFWPARHHVFAGLSYRERVVAELDTWMRKKAQDGSVLIAHSQGSVIAAWALSRGDIPHQSLYLVTCGSPLDTLYCTFFPAEFTPDLRERLVKAVGGRWRNHWRDTDVIASPCAGCSSNTELVDAPTAGKPSGHNNYWNDASHVRGIDVWLEHRVLEGS